MDEKQYYESIFWVDIDRIKPNPFQPRREFDEVKMRELSDSIRQYGLLQPLVVTKKEIEREEGGLSVEYELIAGERRLRASKIAGLLSLPVIIRTGEETNKMKLELAIIENLHREDLNAVDRAKAFKSLMEQYGYKHADIARKMGKSREYVTNTIRMLTLPPELLEALSKGLLSEGITRPLMMLGDRPEEQMTLFKEILAKKLSVREAEAIARRIAVDKTKKQVLPPEMLELERTLTETLGTRVTIQSRDNGGKLMIDFFTTDDIRGIIDRLQKNLNEGMSQHVAEGTERNMIESAPEEEALAREDVPPQEEQEDIYAVSNFSI